MVSKDSVLSSVFKDVKVSVRKIDDTNTCITNCKGFMTGQNNRTVELVIQKALKNEAYKPKNENWRFRCTLNYDRRAELIKRGITKESELEFYYDDDFDKIMYNIGCNTEYKYRNLKHILLDEQLFVIYANRYEIDRETAKCIAYRFFEAFILELNKCKWDPAWTGNVASYIFYIMGHDCNYAVCIEGLSIYNKDNNKNWGYLL